MTAAELPPLPALVDGWVSHTRRTPLTHRFKHRVYQWLVDVDDLPRLPWPLRAFSTFRAEDHLGDPDASIGDNVRRFCALRGVDLTGHRIVMLANARVLGHVFDPLSVFWAFAPEGHLTCLVAEVHNTYGERHAYLLRPDAQGRDRVDKEFYVSPFFSVEGGYDLQFRVRPDVVSAAIVLRQGEQASFSATFRGVPERLTSWRLARLALLRPLMTQRTSALIRFHGVRLWLRRLPIVPRPAHTPQEGIR